MEDLPEYSQLIKTARLEAGYPTQYIFAERIGMPSPVLSQIEHGRRIPSPAQIAKLYKELPDLNLDRLHQAIATAKAKTRGSSIQDIVAQVEACDELVPQDQQLIIQLLNRLIERRNDG